MSDAKTYHHGELRRALVEAALDALEREGPKALTLRSLARTVGVSAMAPYHHFADRSDLLAAVAAEGFRRLQQDKQSALQAVGDDPASALVAGTASYVAFMLSNPNLYRLMQGMQLGNGCAQPELREAAAAPAANLRRLVDQLLSSRESAPNPQRAARALWALAHGVGTLALEGHIGRNDAHTVAREGVESLIAGWLS